MVANRIADGAIGDATIAAVNGSKIDTGSIMVDRPNQSNFDGWGWWRGNAVEIWTLFDALVKWVIIPMARGGEF